MQLSLPTTQYAIQLVGPGKLQLTTDKPVSKPGPYHILAKTEAVGLCFSDMKLLKQFDQHVRKAAVVGGIEEWILKEIPSYVPSKKPTVPGHEVVLRIVEVGERVRFYKPGERWLLQPDFRALKTPGSNAAAGYNFEGALQEYVVFDERVIGDPSKDGSYMIPAPENLGSSAVALVEPWACVENSYVTYERQKPKPGGRMLVVARRGAFPEQYEYKLGRPEKTLGEDDDLTALIDDSYDDIVYFGHDPHIIEVLSDKLAKGGIINIVTGGRAIGRPVNIGVGRIHYGGTRWVGTTGKDPMESYLMIPQTGEIRPRDRILIVGAGGPMGQMHVIRNLCSGMPGLGVVATDLDDSRLEALRRKVAQVAPQAEFSTVNTKNEDVEGFFSYITLMAPVPELLADAVHRASPGGIINLFAGIPAPVKHPIDVDALIEKQVFIFGTSGSETRDMRIVLQKLVEGKLDTDTSVGAVAGMAGAEAGLKAVEERTVDGKIVVYPMLHNLPLILLSELPEKYPTVAAKLDGGNWTPEAEKELLSVASG